MMKLNFKKLGIIIGCLILAAMVVYNGIHYFLEKKTNDSIEGYIDAESVLQKFIKNETVLYLIDKGDGDVLKNQIYPSEDSTVFSLLEEIGEKESFEVESMVYQGMGIFVESIDGIKGGTDDKWWQYFVNDESGEIAADKKEVKKGDKVEWKFEVSPF